MAITRKNTVNREIKELRALRVQIKALKEAEKTLLDNIKNYMLENELEEFSTADCSAKFRNVSTLELDTTLGLDISDLINIAIKEGWKDCLELNEKKYHEHSKTINNGESVFLEKIRKDLRITYKNTKD